MKTGYVTRSRICFSRCLTCLLYIKIRFILLPLTMLLSYAGYILSNGGLVCKLIKRSKEINDLSAFRIYLVIQLKAQMMIGISVGRCRRSPAP
jgi:hypothetical protein